MTLRTQMLRVFQQEDINFLLTNRLPRRLLDAIHRLVEPDGTDADPWPIDQHLAAVLRS